MNIPVRPELPTASAGTSQATAAAVDNSAPLAIRPESTYKSGKVVQSNGATSMRLVACAAQRINDKDFLSEADSYFNVFWWNARGVSLRFR